MTTTFGYRFNVFEGRPFNHEKVLRLSLFPPELVVRGGGVGGFLGDVRCQMGMSKQSQESEVVLGYEECDHADVSQRSPFIEEKGVALSQRRQSEPAKASSTS